MKRLLVTGSRHGWDEYDMAKALSWAYRQLVRDVEDSVVILVHGDAPGVDTLAKQFWEGWGLHTEAHPALWDEYGTDAGPRRNSEMVDLGADLCLAFPSIGSKGTYDTMRKAAAAGIRVVDWSEEGDLT